LPSATGVICPVTSVTSLRVATSASRGANVPSSLCMMSSRFIAILLLTLDAHEIGGRLRNALLEFGIQLHVLERDRRAVGKDVSAPQVISTAKDMLRHITISATDR